MAVLGLIPFSSEMDASPLVALLCVFSLSKLLSVLMTVSVWLLHKESYVQFAKLEIMNILWSLNVHAQEHLCS